VSGDSSLVEAQCRALLEGLEKDLAKRRQEILADARDQARHLLSDARRRARERTRRAVEVERQERADSLQTAEAALETRIRRMRLAVDLELLELGEKALRTALERRWNDTEARTKWLMLALAEAAERLPAGGWRLEYPASLDADWLKTVLQETTADCDMELSPAAELKAGFRIRRGGATLDLGYGGLLAREERIASLLLAELRRGRPHPPEETS